MVLDRSRRFLVPLYAKIPKMVHVRFVFLTSDMNLRVKRSSTCICQHGHLCQRCLRIVIFEDSWHIQPCWYSWLPILTVTESRLGEALAWGNFSLP